MDQEKSTLKIAPEHWVEKHGDILFRFAMSRIKRVDVAEELVQETFLGALRSAKSYQGKATERTWLVAILKHKLIDYIRKQERQRKNSNNEQADLWAESLFDERERWIESPRNWGSNPELSLENEEFWEVFHACLGKVPRQMSTAFHLWEVEDQPVDDVCKELDITQSNLWIILHRARLRLRSCLEINWFDGECTE